MNPTPARKSASGKRQTRAAIAVPTRPQDELHLKALGMWFVGVIAVLLTLGGVIFSFAYPTACERFWAVVGPLLTSAIGCLIYWAAPRRAK
jgi:hypothetical protein